MNPMNLVKRHPEVGAAVLIAVMAILIFGIPAVPKLYGELFGEKPMLEVQGLNGQVIHNIARGDQPQLTYVGPLQIYAGDDYYLGWDSPEENGPKAKNHAKQANCVGAGHWHIQVYDLDGNTIYEFDFELIDGLTSS